MEIGALIYRFRSWVTMVLLVLTSCAGQARWLETPSFSKPVAGTAFRPPLLETKVMEERLVDLTAWTSESGPAKRFRSLFWRDWRKAISPGLSLGSRLILWKELAKKAPSSVERYWADKSLFDLYEEAGLDFDAATWLRLALKEFSNAWDWNRLAWLDEFKKTGTKFEVELAFRLGRQSGLPDGIALRRHLVRLALYYQAFPLQDWGLDDHVSFLAADDDDLWVATWDGGLLRYSTATGEWKLWLKPEIQVSPIKYLVVTHWFVYVFRDKILSRFSKVTETWRDFSLPENWSGLRVQAAVATGEEELYIANLGQGFWKWKSGTWTDLSGALPSRFVNALDAAPQGWWIGTQDRGGGFLSEDGTSFQSWPKGPSNVTFILSKQDSLMVGSFGEGFWSGPPDRLERVQGAPGYVVAGLLLFEKKKPIFWGGTLDEGSFRWDGTSLENFSPDQGFFSTDVTSLAYVGNRIWWGGTINGLGAWIDDTP